MQESPLKLREQITSALHHLDHVLPGQAPILDFVHHNTLHGFQHLPFNEALAEFEALTGINCYLPEAQNRDFYRQGRINESDLSVVFDQCPHLHAEQVICTLQDRIITRQAIYRIALLFDLQTVSVSQLNWQIEELAALETVQADVPEPIRRRLLATDGDVARHLWESILTKLGLEQAALHPEDMLDLSVEQAEEWLASFDTAQDRLGGSVHQQMRQHAGAALDELLGTLGGSISLRGFILALTGTDILDAIRSQLIRFCASGLDEGMAAWQLPQRSELGLYAAWRATAQYDANPFLHELSDWQQIIAELPEDAVDTIILQLSHLEIPQAQWENYLRRLALEIPGWSGLVNWRQHHPNYHTANDAEPTLADYLAIRLTLDRLWLNQICRDTWKIEAKLSSINGYFRKNLSEFMVRSRLYQDDLPEYLAHWAEALTLHAGSERYDRTDWQQLADLIWTWQCSPMADKSVVAHSPHNSGWRLFRLCQHLGLSAASLQQLNTDDLQAMLAVLDEFTLTERSKVWLLAYEHHYREDFLQAIRANHNRGRWAERGQRLDAQIVFCMDDREEGFRRHLEELNPAIETLGAAGFFGVAMNYKGLDDSKVTPLCPVVVTPAHEVREVVRPGSEPMLLKHNRGRKLNQWLAKLVHQGLRRNLLLSQAVIDTAAPVAFAGLLAKSLLPKSQHSLVSGTAKLVSPEVKTQLLFTAKDETVATPERPRLGFTNTEQADRVAGFLRNTGLTYGFSELVVLMGHGSISQNNPHLAAYDCGACSGRHGGPSARVFAAMANRPEVRKLLAERGITIPTDTWFIGAEHNTCNEEISWYDLDLLPAERLSGLEALQQELRHAQHMSAHERCRRLASAPRNPTPKQALAHIEQRAADFSQARPELGHATNASAVVGRRSLTQGAFFDRRVFLISYDPTQDPEGKVLEGILLAVGPVGAGINLEYYFSTVNNERFGCGSKVPHNVTGFFGVMEGASSDLRTGLPRQMVEIHEPMRLLMLVEAKTAVLEQIYHRQESIRELVAGGWVQLSVKDPDSGEIFLFQTGTGFVPWQSEAKDLPVRDNSPDCYRDQTLPVAPMLIKQTQGKPERIGI
ncbi:DUF2309 domain-containing protein [Methylobacter sp.]|uniref:DUF2309 domain-containing protein n=1 Tax=Methylobacter sp. TaxID=2051955 RepID=UPI00122A597F|nr:DUF2309 domain-containing protein [Methylobacter sp.]TAK64146.1 MAG: DUF2309 domain-containing protein [Methylobacter sp.]